MATTAKGSQKTPKYSLFSQFQMYCIKTWCECSWESFTAYSPNASHCTTFFFSKILKLIVSLNLICMLAKHYKNHLMDFNETFTQQTLCVHLQLINSRSQSNFSWLSQQDNIVKNKNSYNSVSFIETELNFDMVVAESHFLTKL